MEEEKSNFPKTEFVMVAGVIALLIFIGIIAAYPQGMKISPSYEVSFEGKGNAFIAGDAIISGRIHGICEMKNISLFNFNNAAYVEINGERFNNTNISITAEEGEMDVDAVLTSPPSFSLIMVNSTEKKVYAMVCKNISLNASKITANLKNASISIDGIIWDGNYTVVISEGFRSYIKAKLLSFPSDGISVSFARGKDCGLIDEFLEETEMEIPPLLFGIDGVFFADEGNVSINGEKIYSNFSIMRGEGDVFFGDGYSLHGNIQLLFINGEFYSKEKASILSFIPNKLLLFWPIAIGIWLVLTFFEKKFGRKFERYDKELGGIAMVIHLFFIFTSFYLWDKEMQYQFGKSIIPAIISSLKGNFGMEEWIVAPFELIPWAVVIVLIAIPIRIILSSIFSFIGLEVLGKGVGKGAGIFMSFFVGIFYVSFFLNIIISPLIKGFIG